jgi:1,4-alpha-glucan branching enzyme
MVSRPTYVGGLGFGLKWDMGWMHDTLQYVAREPVHRRYHHWELSFRMIYAFNENFMLPLSHDEVVHGKQALLAKMPGDVWQKFANLRLLYGYLFTQPGKKLLFMGGDIGQWDEWHHDRSLDWHLLEYAPHQGIARLVQDLNRLYSAEPALHELDLDPAGFEWVDHHDAENSTLSYLRKARSDPHPLLVACNFTPVPRQGYHVGVPRTGYWREIFNSDAQVYGGGGVGNWGGVDTDFGLAHGRPVFLNLTLPPLGVVVLKHEDWPT